MKNPIKIVLLILICQFSFAQKLVYKNRGNIKDDNGNYLSSTEVRLLLANNESLLAEYNNGREKKTAGNILLIGGAALAVVPTAIQLYNGQPVSQGILGLGIVSMVVAIPVKIGFTRKIKHVVSEFNSQKAIGVTNFQIQNMDLITNSNGIGFRLTLD